VESIVTEANSADHTESLLQAGQKVGLQKNVQRPRKQLFMCLLQNAGREWNKTIVNKAFEQVSDLKGNGTWAHKNITN
jgi:hypothetical protein